MSRTYKDVRKEYLPDTEQNNYRRSCRCDSWCRPEKQRSRKTYERNALEIELSAYNLSYATTSITQLLKELSDENI